MKKIKQVFSSLRQNIVQHKSRWIIGAVLVIVLALVVTGLFRPKATSSNLQTAAVNTAI